MGVLKNLYTEYSSEMIDDFFSHYSVMCDVMEELIIGLERADCYQENAEELFKIFSNINSSSSYMDIAAIEKLTMLCQDVMDDARKLRGPANEKFVDWLLLISDQFNSFRKDLELDSDYFAPLNPKIIEIPDKFDV